MKVEENINTENIGGKAYATGKRKNSIARVWITRGSGRITVNKLDIEKKNELNSFEGLLNFLKLQKEIALYTDLSDKIRLLDYRIGYLKFSVEGEYKDDFIKNIRNKLSSLTNLNWNIDLSDDDSAHTYTKLKDMELNIKKENIRNNPLVESIIDNFPDYQISEIKDK